MLVIFFKSLLLKIEIGKTRVEPLRVVCTSENRLAFLKIFSESIIT
jgi:hypothetical protein